MRRALHSGSWLMRYNDPLASLLTTDKREQPSRQGGSRTAKPVSAVAAAQRPKGNGYGFIAPLPWPYDGGTRREAVLDIDRNPPRIVRHVGWPDCMCCRKPFWSDDTRHVRICEPCKAPERDQRKPQRQ
jgi:hypothetical protein